MRLKFESLHGYFMKIFKYLNDNTKVAYIYVMYTYVQQKKHDQYHCTRYGLDKKNKSHLLFTAQSSYSYAYWNKSWSINNIQAAQSYKNYVNTIRTDARKQKRLIFKVPSILYKKYLPVYMGYEKTHKIFIEVFDDTKTGESSLVSN